MVRVRKELDHVSNSKKEDRIIKTRLSSTTTIPQKYEEKKNVDSGRTT
jgi:hypothetical protein